LINTIANQIGQNVKFLTLFLFILSIAILAFGLSALFNPSVEIEWKTESEIDTLGFQIYRVNVEDDNNITKVNEDIIFAEGSSINGSNYTYTDVEVVVGETYSYQLYEIQLNNEAKLLGSLEVMVKYQGLVEIGISIVLMVIAIIWKKKVAK
jgi:hypothetical protein